MPKKKEKFNPVDQLPKLHPEPDYEVKTRPPMWGDWRLNIWRGLKENRLRTEAQQIARRKCWETGKKFEECSKDKGMWMVTTRCRAEYDAFCTCIRHEIEVELDKLRRDTSRHTEWWWLNLYDESGEIGEQKLWKPESSLHKMWFKNIFYNIVFKPKVNEEKMTELEIKQGTDIVYVKHQIMEELKK